MPDIPLDLKSLLIKIAVLELKADFAQGQANLLLSFIASDPHDLTKFADMVKLCITQPEIEENTRDVAQKLLNAGLSKYLSPQPSLNQQTTTQTHQTSAKIIQFPTRPMNKKDHP